MAETKEARCWISDAVDRDERSCSQHAFSRAASASRAWKAYREQTGISWEKLAELQAEHYAPPYTRRQRWANLFDGLIIAAVLLTVAVPLAVQFGLFLVGLVNRAWTAIS